MFDINFLNKEGLQNDSNSKIEIKTHNNSSKTRKPQVARKKKSRNRFFIIIFLGFLISSSIFFLKVFEVELNLKFYNIISDKEDVPELDLIELLIENERLFKINFIINSKLYPLE